MGYTGQCDVTEARTMGDTSQCVVTEASARGHTGQCNVPEPSAMGDTCPYNISEATGCTGQGMAQWPVQFFNVLSPNQMADSFNALILSDVSFH